MKKGRISRLGAGGILLTSMLSLTVPLSAYAETYDISVGNINISADSAGQTVNGVADASPVITGTSNQGSVSITAGSGATANVTFNNLTIHISLSSAPVSVAGAGNVVIELDGINSLQESDGEYVAALMKSGDGNLTIKDDNGISGTLTATSQLGGAGIGGGNGGSATNITISGGNVTATGGNGGGAGIGGGAGGSGSYIEISTNGTVIANGGVDSAGIGGGTNGSGSNITISGGTVTASTSDLSGAAGIGGGTNGNGTAINIGGGNVTATGGSEGGAGIGGGQSGYGRNITITGGTVTATGGCGESFHAGAGIGGGEQGAGSDIIISDGTVTAIGGMYYGAGIGGGNYGEGSSITISGGTVTATGGIGGAGIGGGYNSSADDIELSGGTVIAVGGTGAAGIGSGLHYGNTGSNDVGDVVIRNDAIVYAAGGAEDSTNGLGSGASIGHGGSNANGGTAGDSVVPNTDGLYTTGSISLYASGTTVSQISQGSGTLSEPPITGTVETPVTPINPSTPAESGGSFNFDNSDANVKEQTSSVGYVAFIASTGRQVEDLLKKISAAIAAGNTQELNALRTKGIKIEAGNWISFRKDTYLLIERAVKMGVPVTVNFAYKGTNYSTTIPAYTKISPVSLCNEEGYCGFLNLIKHYGGIVRK